MENIVIRNATVEDAQALLEWRMRRLFSTSIHIM